MVSYRRIKFDRIKRYSIKAGIIGVPTIFVLFILLNSLSAIDIISYSGDSICAGTTLDPCIANIVFKVKTDIYIYPINESSQTALLNTDKKLKSIVLKRSWGKGYRTIYLNKTWNKNVKYALKLSKGKTYNFTFFALKNSPYDTIKWGAFSGVDKIDPIWKSPYTIPITKRGKLKDRKYKEYLRDFDSNKVSNKKSGKNRRYKTYDSSNRKIIIEDNKFNKLMELELTSNYRTYVYAGKDIKIAEIKLIDFDNKIKTKNLLDNLGFYNIKNDYKDYTKNYQLKYKKIGKGVKCQNITVNNPEEKIKLKCFSYSKIKWTSFNKLSELPNRNITIGIFIDTKIGENVEWVPTIEGFESLEWASYLVNGLVSYYKLDEVSGTVLDTQGTHNGSNSGAIPYVQGKINTAYNFDNTYDDILLGTTTDFKSENFSISTWINANTISGNDGIFGSLSTSVKSGFLLGISNGIPIGYIDNSISLVSITGDIISTSSWYNIVLTYDSSNLSLYINGKLNNTIIGNYTPYILGSTSIGDPISQNGWDALDGRIDEVGYWSKALSSSEVLDLYNNGHGFAYPFNYPYIVLTSPKDNSYINTLGITDFKCNINSNITISNVTFYTDYGGSFIANRTNSSGVNGDYIFSINVNSQTPINWNCYACDIGNNCNFSQSNYTLNFDLTTPTYSLNQTNNTNAGQSTLFSILYNDDVALHPTGRYIFSTNNTGTWVNDSAVNWTTTPNWANVTKTLSSTAKVSVGYRWYADDNVGNWNNTPLYTLEIIDTIPPYFTLIPNNLSIEYSKGFGVDFNGVDDGTFDSYFINWSTLFMINQTGYLENKTPNIPIDTYYINVSINDSVGNVASTIFKISVINYTLKISKPITSNPKSVLSGDNTSINFIFQKNGINLTSGVYIKKVLIGGINTEIVKFNPIKIYPIDFETFTTNFGNWTQATFDTDDWSRGTSTPSGGTGPQTTYDGTFAYVETSTGYCNSPDNAVLYRSPEINFSLYETVNISFVYNMYGGAMGTLYVKENTTGNWVSLWNLTGNQGTSWFNKTVSITGKSGAGNIAIWMDCGNSYTSDAAVDSINITAYKSHQFEYISGIGWQVNITVPIFVTGLKDLFLNATYLGFIRNDTQTNAIDYGGVSNSCTCPSVNTNWVVSMSDYCNLTSSCNLGTGNLSWTGTGYFNCSAQLNLTNRNAPPVSSTFYFSSGCEVIRL